MDQATLGSDFVALVDKVVNRIQHHRWRWNVRKYFVDLDRVSVESPVFLLGTQAGGLTLLSRVLRRHPRAVSVTGDADYWTGSDELQNVLSDALPDDLRLRGHPELEHRDLQEGWLYATDDLLPAFRRTAEDVGERTARILLRRIRELLVLHGGGESGLRFVDKSQSYTVKVAFLAHLLAEHDPRFLLVTRNPYAVCRRAEMNVLTGLGLSRPERLRLAVQHWDNSMRCALRDGRSMTGFGTIRFEDFLKEPEATLAEIDDVVEIGLEPEFLPGPDDNLPLGTPPDGKWYPLRPRVNQKYLSDLPSDVVEAVETRCGDLAERFGYTPEGP